MEKTRKRKGFSWQYSLQNCLLHRRRGLLSCDLFYIGKIERYVTCSDRLYVAESIKAFTRNAQTNVETQMDRRLTPVAKLIAKPCLYPDINDKGLNIGHSVTRRYEDKV